MLVISVIGYSQAPSYYNDVDLTLSGNALKNELASKVTTTHITFLSYTPGIWDALKQTDLDPTNAAKVILMYGYNDTDGVSSTDRTRGVNNNGGGSTDWNREHVYPKSLGIPNLGTTGPGADAHHLRPADVSRNSSRSNRKFADGSGNSGATSQGHWYPGDEFRGDVARMMMYMYIRYGNRCLPKNVGVGSAVSGDGNMIQLFLEWNAEDPVSSLELQRNPVLQNLQGNRNPFIDNPAFATQIWGGPQAEDRFGNVGGGNTLCTTTINSFPYSESFESGVGEWNQARSSDDFDWIRTSGSTPSSNTGPGAASSGAYYLYMESSSPNFSNKRAILYSPCYNITNASQATFSFKYHMSGTSNMGSLAVEASLNGTSWTSVWSKSGNQGNSWETASINLSSYLGEKVQLRFNGVTGTTWQGDMAIDEINFSTSGNSGGGSTGNNITLSITFDMYPEETSWEIRNDLNQVVDSGGTYDTQPDDSTIDLTRTLDSGCYTLVFKDAYGDGICCSYGNGSYELTKSDDGVVLASGGSFGSEEIKSFCIDASKSINSNSTARVSGTKVSIDIHPNPTTAILYLKTSAASIDDSFSIKSQLGQHVMEGRLQGNEIDVNRLKPGLYLFTIMVNGESQTKWFIKR